MSGTTALPDTRAEAPAGTRPLERGLRVRHMPGSTGPASYVGLLESALAEAGLTLVDGGRSLFEEGRHRTLDVVHLHWLEFISASDPRPRRGLPRTLARHLRLLSALAWLRMRGIRVVWTIHNLASHEPARPRLEWILGLLVSRLADRLIVHSRYAGQRAAERWGASKKITVIPHGNYIDVFPSTGRSPAESRDSLTIPDSAYVFVAFGQVRRYKRLPELVSAFSTLAAEDARLLIVGSPVDEAEAERLRMMASRDPRVILDLRHVPDAEVADVLGCADAAVLAYRDVFSSGALLLALSFGLPVVAAASSTAGEIAGPAAAETFESGGLAEAMRAVQGGDRKARSVAALDAARRYPWSRVGSETAALYRALRARDTASTS